MLCPWNQASQGDIEEYFFDFHSFVKFVLFKTMERGSWCLLFAVRSGHWSTSKHFNRQDGAHQCRSKNRSATSLCWSQKPSEDNPHADSKGKNHIVFQFGMMWFICLYLHIIFKLSESLAVLHNGSVYSLCLFILIKYNELMLSWFLYRPLVRWE